MNAHFNPPTRRDDSQPSEQDYAFFRRLPFLQLRAPFYGEKLETVCEPAPQVEAVAAEVIVQKAAPQKLGLTTAQINNVAEPYLAPMPVKKCELGPERVNITELLDISISQKVRLGQMEIEIVCGPEKSIAYRTRRQSKTISVKRGEVLSKKMMAIKGLPAASARLIYDFHQELRSLYLKSLEACARDFLLTNEYLESLKDGEYIKVSTKNGRFIFKVLGDKREKRLEFTLALRGELGIPRGVSIRLRSFQTGQTAGLPGQEMLLQFFQNNFA